VFLLVTVAMGGSCAYITGRAIAETWRPFWQVIAYALALTFVVRFLHFALFEEVMMSARNFLVDAVVLAACALAGHAIARRRQMAIQYGWTAMK
jgi:hypothetical protein